MFRNNFVRFIDLSSLSEQFGNFIITFIAGSLLTKLIEKWGIRKFSKIVICGVLLFTGVLAFVGSGYLAYTVIPNLLSWQPNLALNLDTPFNQIFQVGIFGLLFFACLMGSYMVLFGSYKQLKQILIVKNS